MGIQAHTSTWEYKVKVKDDDVIVSLIAEKKKDLRTGFRYLPISFWELC